MKFCDHKIPADHRRGEDWICSRCGKVGRWGPSWGYYGNVECMRCGWAQIDFVWCSDACRGELEAGRGPASAFETGRAGDLKEIERLEADADALDEEIGRLEQRAEALRQEAEEIRERYR